MKQQVEVSFTEKERNERERQVPVMDAESRKTEKLSAQR
jgi:hypothetical protein